MNKQPTASCFLRSRARCEHGVAVVVLLYGISIFSALAITLLRNTPLEKALQTASDPDLHVVLYAGGAGSPAMVGRLNLPAAWRNEEVPDQSTEVRIPGAPQLDLASELPQGWSFAVRLSPHARVCCDAGDGACANVTWNEEITAGSVSPELTHPFMAPGEKKTLKFSLSSLSVPSNVELDPNATASSAFLVRATRILEGSNASLTEGQGSQQMVCKLESSENPVATGTLRIEPGRDESGAVTRISTGTVEIDYRRSGGSR
jgi:hypothetical protein